MVGGSLYSCLQQLGFSHIDIHDPYKSAVVSAKTAENADVLFYCVNEPDGMISDGTLIEFMTGKLVILKTTLMIGETEQLQSMYPAIHFVYMPEFLRENHAVEDMMNPDHLIYGSVTPEYSVQANELFIGLKAPRFFVEPKAAEIFKLVSNTYPLVKLIFFNQIYDLCQERDVNYEEVIAPMLKNKFNSGTYMSVVDKGGRGGGGKCLPKDAAILFNTRGMEKPLLRAVREANLRLLMESGKA
jgi:UDP-glucose 6-dehydrogenase